MRKAPRPVARLVVLVTVGSVVAMAVGAWFLMNGEPTLTLGQMWHALTGGTPASDDIAAQLVRDLRLPRLLLAILAGASLGLAGTILQYSLRNPIADPGLLGVSEAASFVVATTLLFPEAVPNVALPVMALVAGLLTGAILVVLARSVRDPIRLLLIGVVIAGLLTVMTFSVLLLVPPSRAFTVSQVFVFTSGSVAFASWERVVIVLPWIIIGIPIALASGRSLNLLQLGDDMAIGRGMRVTRTRMILFVAAVLLVAPIVAVAGPIALVALVSPHVARALLRTANAHLVLPASAVIGAVVMVIADTMGRLLFFPLEIPAGVWTIITIGPFAVWLARRSLRPSVEGVPEG